MMVKRAQSQLRTGEVENINGENKKRRWELLYLQIYFPERVVEERIETAREETKDENIPQAAKTLKPPPILVPKISIKR